MTSISSARAWVVHRPSLRAGCGYLVLAAAVIWWTWRALHDSHPFDTGLAYQAGQVAWATGHPEHLATWNGAPLLAVIMAVAGRVLSMGATADLMTVVNALAATVTISLVLVRLRPLLPRAWWWVIALGLVTFPPLMSTVWWKQFSLVALALAVGGYELLRRERVHLGAVAIALSVSFKPVAVLLPVALLLHRDTRRAGLLALGWIVAVDIASQAFMAWRAHDLAVLDPTIGIRNFVHKTNPVGDVFLCHPDNFAPTSLVCRAVGGPTEWQLQRAFVYVGLLVLCVWTLDALRGRGPLSWERFAFVCAISIMVGPLEWAHYWVMLAPLFVVLTVAFVRDGARWTSWVGLLVAFALIALIWQPYGSILDAVREALGHRENLTQLTVLNGVAQFGQYALVLTGLLWYGRSSPAIRAGA